MSPARVLASGIALLAIAGCETPSKAPAMASERALPGTSWVGVVPDTIERSQAPRLEFATDGTLTGYTGCNQLRGSYVLHGDRLEIVAITSKRACVGAGGDVEQRFLTVITGSPRYRVGERGLTITSAKGERFEFSEAPRSN